MAKSIPSIFKEIEEEKNQQKKIEILQSNWSPALKMCIDYGINPNLKWLLPEGPVPYTPAKIGDNLHNQMYQAAKKLYLFVEGGHPSLKQSKREQLFIDMLEGLHADDAEMVCLMKDKKFASTYPSINLKFLKKAAPGIY